MSRNRYRGGTGKFEAVRRGVLEARLKKDDIQTQEQAGRVIGEEFAAHYTVGGVSYLFQRLQIKLKTLWNANTVVKTFDSARASSAMSGQDWL